MSRLSRVTWLTRADLGRNRENITLANIISKRLIRTINHLNVLLCRANRVHAARIAGETSYSTLVGVADLLPGAILVRLALDGLAADLIVLGVPEESGFAGANGGVIVRLASSVPPAEEQVARFATLRLANVVLHASLVVRAIVVRRATQLLHADVVVTVLVLGATGVALASRLAEAVDAQLVAYAISRAGAQRCNEDEKRLNRSKGKLNRSFRSYRCISLHCKPSPWRIGSPICSIGQVCSQDWGHLCHQVDTCTPHCGSEESSPLLGRKRWRESRGRRICD